MVGRVELIFLRQLLAGLSPVAVLVELTLLGLSGPLCHTPESP